MPDYTRPLENFADSSVVLDCMSLIMVGKTQSEQTILTGSP